MEKNKKQLENFLESIEKNIKKYYLIITDTEDNYDKEIVSVITLASLPLDLPKIRIDYYKYYSDINEYLPQITIPRVLLIEMDDERKILADLKLINLGGINE